MTVQTIYITYPTGDIERIKARSTVTAGEFEVRSHAFLCPLAPGDRVRVDANAQITEVVSLEPQFVFHVDLHLPIDFLAGPLPAHHPGVRIANQITEGWARDTTLTHLTTFNFVISSSNWRWFDENVNRSRYVDFSTMTRTPVTTEFHLECSPVL
jgi:hypothetical protein